MTKNQHESDLGRVLGGFQDTSHMEVVVEAVPGSICGPRGGSRVDFGVPKDGPGLIFACFGIEYS